MLDIEDVQREVIRLVDEKGELERERDQCKRASQMEVSEVRSELMKRKDDVDDFREELHSGREDLRYWKERLALEKIRVMPVYEQVRVGG